MNFKEIVTRLFSRPSGMGEPASWEVEPPQPIVPRTVLSALGQPPALSHTLSVDRVLAILRQAESGDCQDLFSVYREILLGHAHTQTVFNQRKLSALTKALTIIPGDRDPLDQAAAKACEALTSSSGWLSTAMNHLLNGHLYPLAVLEQVYAPNQDRRFPGVRVVPVQWLPVPYHLLDWTDGRLQIWEADPKFGQRLATRYEPASPQFIVHRGHLLTNIPDNWGGPMRAALFWWLFATMDRDWWVRFLDRFGAPFIVGKYDQADDASRTLLARAFAAATRLFGLVVSRDTDIQVHSVATASHGEAFEKMQVFANGELSKLVLGQTMTTTASAGGIGGTQAMVQDNVRGDIEAWDITALGETVNRCIIDPFLRFNGFTGTARLSIATGTGQDMERQAKFLAAAATAGLEPTDAGIEALSKSTGIPLQRTAKSLPLTLSAFSVNNTAMLRSHGQPTDAELDGIASAGASDLSAAFRGRYAPLRRLLSESKSLRELEAGLAAFTTGLDQGEASRVIQDTLTAYAATGAASARFS